MSKFDFSSLTGKSQESPRSGSRFDFSALIENQQPGQEEPSDSDERVLRRIDRDGIGRENVMRPGPGSMVEDTVNQPTRQPEQPSGFSIQAQQGQQPQQRRTVADRLESAGVLQPSGVQGQKWTKHLANADRSWQQRIAGDQPDQGIAKWINTVSSSAIQGIGMTVGTAGDIYGLATGAMDNLLARAGDGISGLGQSTAPQSLVDAQSRRAAAIGDTEGFWDAFGTAAVETARDPQLLLSFFVEQIPNLAATGFAGRGAGLAANALGAGSRATAGAATAGAVGTGALMHGADTGSDTFERLLSQDDALWAANPAYEALIEEGVPEDEARETIALELSRLAALKAAGVSIGVNLFSPARALDRALAGSMRAGGNVGRKAVLAALAEGAGEAIEEGTGRVFSNMGVQEVNPEQQLLEGAGEAAGMGALFAPLGGVAGGMEALSEVDMLSGQQTEPPSQQADFSIQGSQIDGFDMLGGAVPAQQSDAYLGGDMQVSVEGEPQPGLATRIQQEFEAVQNEDAQTVSFDQPPSTVMAEAMLNAQQRQGGEQSERQYRPVSERTGKTLYEGVPWLTDYTLPAGREDLPEVDLGNGERKPFDNPKLMREPYRQGISYLMTLIQKKPPGPNLAVRTGAQPNTRAPTGDIRQDYAPEDLIRLPSTNPGWFQEINAQTGATVEDVKKAVRKALAGQRLGTRQAEIVNGLLAHVEGERSFGYSDNGTMEYQNGWRDMIKDYRDQQRAQRGELTDAEIERMSNEISANGANIIGMTLAEVEYQEGLEAGDRALYDVVLKALSVDEALTQQILASDYDDTQTFNELKSIIAGLHESQDPDAGIPGEQGPGDPEAGSEQAKGAPAETAQPGGDAGADSAVSSEPGQSEQVASLQEQIRRLEQEIQSSNERAEQAEQRLRVDALTGLLNRHAFIEDQKAGLAGFYAYLDLDGLGWINDNIGHDPADQVLKVLGEAMVDSGLSIYRIGGDEFVVRADSDTVMKDINALLKELGGAEFNFVGKNGTKYTIQGIRISMGTGNTYEDADAALNEDKQARAESGLRAKRKGDQPPNIEPQADRRAQVEQPAEGSGAGVGQVPKREGDQAVDLAGAVDPTAQAQSDADRARQEQADQSPDMLEGDGDLFAGPRPGQGDMFGPKEVEAAAADVDTDPSDAQIKAGNYKKGHVKINGLDITIENPRGSTRSGKDRNGREWEQKMAHHYGYIKRTSGADGEHVDVFIGPDAGNADLPVFVIDQMTPDGQSFDEHKVMLGFDIRSAAISGYLANYSDDWKGLGAVVEMSLDDFKVWLAESDTGAPAQADPGPGAKPEPSGNTIFTDDAAEEARKLLRSKLGQINTGIDPDVFRAGVTLAGYHIERGARTFAAYAKAMIEDLGEGVKPYLKQWYMGVLMDPSATTLTGTDPLDAVQSADVDTILEQSDESDIGESGNLEPDRAAVPLEDEVGTGDLFSGPRSDAGESRAGAQSADGETRQSGGQRVPERPAPAPGKRSNLAVQTGATGSGRGDPGSGERDGGRDAGLDGAPVEPESTAAIEASTGGGVSRSDVASRQAAANKAGPQGDSIEAIRAELPALFPGQQEDVLKAEQRFAQPDGYGMLFTNGTGTGKTFTGLGVVRRMVNRGKSNILIVVPSDKIASDWVDSGKYLGLTVNRLADTNDAGEGVTITTYANMRQNDALVSRDWDALVADEAHYLLQSASGELTGNLNAFRALSLFPDSAVDRTMMKHRDWYEERREAIDKELANKKIISLDDTRDEQRAQLKRENERLGRKINMLTERIERAEDAERDFVAERQGEARTRAMFLSATPFAYEKTVQWAQGYLFDWNEGKEENTGLGYNTGGNYEQFMMLHFGYRMRYNKLTEPGPEVNRGLMQRQFNTWLKKQGVLSGRMLDVEADYERGFELVESSIGRRIDEALQWVQRSADEAGFDGLEFSNFRTAISDQFDHLSRRYLLEAIKAKQVIPLINEHLDLGRKVVVFHDFKKGGGFNPFRIMPRGNAGFDAIVQAFNQEFGDLVDSDLGRMPSPINGLSSEFPDLLLFNGDVSKKQRRENAKKFNDDASGPQVILVQSAAGKEGISLHDTTGKHQRVLFNLGLPTAPTTAIQQEGRIYRTGQVSNAIFRYLNTGTNWERWAFAQTIAQRASGAENLGMGEQARALMDSFIAGFEQSGRFPAGMEGEGAGGKAIDAAANAALTEFDRAKSYYFATQKKTSKTKAAEGVDYFATPEPLGMKMVEWANARGGESVLEPSAGHGAIARWMPENVTKTAIEPSNELASRLALSFDGKILPQRFEGLHISNKFDAVVMNPPFGRGGKTAIEHLDKATGHLRKTGGRVVAIIPRGPAADKRFDQWLYAEDEKGRMVRPDLNLVASIDLPAATFERAGTKVAARVVIIDKGDAPPQVNRDLSNAESIGEFFDRIEDMSIPERVVPEQQEVSQESQESQSQPAPDGTFETAETVHAKKGIDLFVAKVVKRVDRDTFSELRRIAKANNGYYSRFARDGAIPGFQFESEADRAKFLQSAERRMENEGMNEAGPLYRVDRGQVPEGLGEVTTGQLRPTGVSEGPGQLSLFLSPKNQGTKTPKQRMDVAKRVRSVEVATLRSGLERADTPAKAAHVVAQLRKSADEVFGFLVTDENDRPIAFQRLTRGSTNATMVNLNRLGEIFQIPNAVNVWATHNHPSGEPPQSGADARTNARIDDALEGTGLRYRGSLVVAPGGNYSHLPPSSRLTTSQREDDYEASEPIPASLRNRSVPVRETVIRGPASDQYTIDSPQAGKMLALKELDGRSGVILLDTKNRPAQVIEMTRDEMSRLRTGDTSTGFGALASAVSATNAGAAFVVDLTSDTPLAGPEAQHLINVGSALKALDINPLDIFSTQYGDIVSRAERGLGMSSDDGNFYSRRAAGQPMFAMGDGGGTTREAIVGALSQRAQKALVDSGLITITETPAEWPGSHPEDAAAVYMGGKVYMAASNIQAGNERGLILHEIGVHRGLKRMLGTKDYNRLIRQIQTQVKRGARQGAGKAARDAYEAHQRALADDTITNDAALWEETIAYMAEAGASGSLFKEIVALIKRALRSMGLARGFTAADVAHLARGSVRRQVAGKLDDGAIETTYAPAKYQRAASEAQDQTQTPEFKRWFGDSKVVDENGEPLVVYHGSGARGTKVFDPRKAGDIRVSDWGRGVYFTPKQWMADSYRRDALKETDAEASRLWNEFESEARKLGTSPMMMAIDLGFRSKKYNDLKKYENRWRSRLKEAESDNQSGEVYAAYVSLQNPLIHVPGDITEPNLDEYAKEKGHDGIIITHGDGTGIDEVIAFRSEQIKSATGNQGTFDPDNPDIRYSRRTGKNQDEEQDWSVSFNLDPKTLNGKLLPEAMEKAGLAPKRPPTKRFMDSLQSRLYDGWRKDASDEVKQGVFDRFHGLKMAEQQFGGALPTEQSAYVAARLSTGIASTMRALMIHGAPEWRDGVVSRVEGSVGLLDMLKPVRGDLNAFLGWRVGRRAQRLLNEGRENNLSQSEIDALIQNGEAAENYGEFQRVNAQLDEFISRVLDVAQGAGLIDPKSRATWEQSDYIPFYRIGEPEVRGATGPNKKAGLSGQSSGIRRLRGGEQAISDPLENLMMNLTHLMDASMKNEAIRRAHQNLEGSGLFEEVGKDFKPEVVPLSQVKRILKAQGVDTSQFPPAALRGMAKMWAIKPPNDPDVVRIMDGGKPKYYRVNDPMLLRALTAVRDPGNNATWVRVGRSFKRVLTRAVTADPAFMARNFMRDMLHAWTINEDHFIVGVDSVRGAWKSMRESGGAVDMMFAGGSFMGGYVNATDPSETARATRIALREKGYSTSQVETHMNSIVDTSLKGWEIYTRFGDSIENANREAVFEAAIRAGKSRAQAIFEAKDLMDYSMRGDYGAYQILTDVIPFLNARAQGMYKLGRAGFANPVRVTAKGLVISAATLALLARNQDDERYQDLEDWDKDTYWHFFFDEPIEFNGRRVDHIRLPKPFEIGAIFGTGAERIAQNMLGNETTRDTYKSFMWNLRHTFAMDMPQAVAPALEVLRNRNTFTDAPIETLGDRRLSSEYRAGTNTSPIMRDLGEYTGRYLGLSPKQLEHLYNGYLGTLGMYGLSAADAIYRAADPDSPPRPQMRIDEMPVIRSFLRAEPARGTRWNTALYDIRREAQEAFSSVRSLEADGRLDDADEELARRARTLPGATREDLIDIARPELNDAAEYNSWVRRELDAVIEDPDMSPEEKRQAIDELIVMRNDNTKSVVKDLVEFFRNRAELGSENN